MTRRKLPEGRKAGHPTLRRHKSSGHGYAKFNRKQVWFGPFDDPDTHTRFERYLAEWLARGRTLPESSGGDEGCTVADLADAFLGHADVYYRRKDGTPTGEKAQIEHALGPLLELYRELPVGRFSLPQLETVRSRMEDAGLARTTVNSRVDRLVRMFRWGARKLMFPAEVLGPLDLLEPLQPGRCKAQDRAPRRPVPEADFWKTAPHMNAQARALCLALWWTAARPGELVMLRSRYVDMSGAVWQYRPPHHKTAHRGKVRIIDIGPKAQEALQPFVQLDPDRAWFRPCDALEAGELGPGLASLHDLAARHGLPRNTAFCWTQRKRDPLEVVGRGLDGSLIVREADFLRLMDRYRPLGGFRAEQPRRRRRAAGRSWKPPGEVYTVKVLHHAVQRACRRAKVEPWTPYALRHAALDRIRRTRGIEAAVALGGHTDGRVTELYTSEAKRVLSRDVMAELG